MYRVNSYAKINLSLDVLGKRDDGYHNIDTIMQLIDLKDQIYIDLIPDDKLIIETNSEDVPINEDNLIYKIWDELKQYRKENSGLKVYIEKNIPVAAGLAGGSSNAAYFMKAVNELWKLKLTKEDMKNIGKKYGADIPYFFEEGTTRAINIGYDFKKIKNFSNVNVLIINDGCKVSTEYVYKNIILSEKSNIDKCIETIESENPFVKENYYNTMTDISNKLCPSINSTIKELYENNADVALMSGSGSTVFGLYSKEENIIKDYNNLKEKYKFVYMTKTL